MVSVFRGVMLAVAWICLILGLWLPILRFERFYFFSEAPSLLELVAALWREQDMLLATIVCLFSVMLPMLKLATLSVMLLWPPRSESVALPLGRLGRVVPYLAKWSMMDVMLVAIIIVAAKTSGLAQAFTQPGLWFYAASALLAGLLPLLKPVTVRLPEGP